MMMKIKYQGRLKHLLKKKNIMSNFYKIEKYKLIQIKKEKFLKRIKMILLQI